MAHRQGQSANAGTRPAVLAGLVTLAILLLAPSASLAGTTKCKGTVAELTVYAYGPWEGALRVEIEGGFGSKSWILCSLDEGRTDANGDHRAKNGQLVSAVNDTSREACESAFDLLVLARATNAEVQISFLNSGSGADPVFDSCDTVPEDGGITQVAGEDDPGQRLGGWDSFYGVTVR